jgi:outer membrane protein TolC
VPPISLANTARIDSLLREGSLYLSLDDAIALALENNLDVELRRYNPAIASSDVLRAEGGGVTRGVDATVGELPAGLGGPISPLLNAATPTGSVPTGGSVAVNVTDAAALLSTATNLSITGTGSLSPGTPIAISDPVITGQLSANHVSTPQSSSFITGSDVLIQRNIGNSLAITQGFSPGTLVSLVYNDQQQTTNSLRSSFSPFTTSTLGLTVTQPLLRGFGINMNRRYIRIAKNDRRMSDLVFRQQAIDTVAGVIRLYYDFVSLMEDVRVKRQALGLAQKLLSDNEAQVKAGTLAPIEVVRAQALVASSQQDVANSNGFAKEQELILKTVLTRRGTADPLIRTARLVPTTAIPQPPQTPEVQPIQDLLDTAFKNRPDLQAADVQLDNSRISLEGSINELRPDISLFVTAQNSGLAGSVNPALPAPSPSNPFASAASPTFLGGFGTALGQLFRRSYPTYGAGINLALPLRNRVAQADAARDQLQVRQSEIRRQQLQNTVRLSVEDAVIALERTRAAYNAAVQARVLQEQSLDAEQKKYQVGLSTTFELGQYQQQLTQAESTEAAARGAWAKAQSVLEQSIGMTLDNHQIAIDEVYKGRLSRPPAALPSAGAPTP